MTSLQRPDFFPEAHVVINDSDNCDVQPSHDLCVSFMGSLHSYSNVSSDECGNHETQVSEGAEADLHKYLVGCKKNPGHKQFIPVHLFSLKHLPEGHRDNDLYEFIKVVADLTVRVDVVMTSKNRPSFWPKTKISYPFFDIRESRIRRIGSGAMFDVKVYSTAGGDTNDESQRNTNCTKCWCTRCQGSDSPSNKWWVVDVVTVAHVVFDDQEATHTSIRLFYDKDDSPLVSLDKIRMVYSDIEGDLCWLRCVTCDKNLGNKLMQIFQHWNVVNWKVRKKYLKSRDMDRLNFIVSHPHGCSKQVSVGQWKDSVLSDKDHIRRFTYTTCTCPGSSGAPVHCVGYGWQGWQKLIHSGSMKSGLNYSIAGGVY